MEQLTNYQANPKANGNGSIKLEDKDLETLTACNIIPSKTPREQVNVFAKVCYEKSLSPFSRQIYLMKRSVKNGDKYEDRYTIQTGIDGYRVLAERTGTYAGNDDYIFDEGLNQYQMLKEKRPIPTTASVTVYKIVGNMRVPFTATAQWEAYFPGDKQGFMWRKMPFLMLGKCAEALALRKAFPEALGGIYTDTEMQQAEYENVEKVEAKNIAKLVPAENAESQKQLKAESGPFQTKLRDYLRELCGGKMSKKQAIAKLSEVVGVTFSEFPTDEKECSTLLANILAGGKNNG